MTLRLLLLMLMLSSSQNAIADNKWGLSLPSGEVAKVLTKRQGSSVTYYLTVGNRPPLSLLRVHRLQQMDVGSTSGFIRIADQNTASQKILFRLKFRSSASGSGHGQCGAGIEEYLFIVDVNHKMLSTLHRVPLESCWSDISLSNEIDNVQVFQDAQRNESGIKIKYDAHPRWAAPIAVTFSLDNEFFNFEARK